MTFGDDDETSNPSGSPSLEQISTGLVTRRFALSVGIGVVSLPFLSCRSRSSPRPALAERRVVRAKTLLGFEQLPTLTRDEVVVPKGYRVSVLYAWGDPVSDGPAFAQDASNASEDQAQQAGMHHDGLHFFPLGTLASSERGILVVNHEYTDDGLLHTTGMDPWTPEKVAKSQASHGVSVIEIARKDGRFEVERPSRFARRITARTPIRVGGPLAGHARLRTQADREGSLVLGTIANCACGNTPWGTYLTCEENWHGYFVNPKGEAKDLKGAEKARVLRDQARYGIGRDGAGYRWHEHDQRFDASLHPNEPYRFGWVVEIDPFDREAAPVKRTALGRFKHEGACTVETRARHVAVYMADDERFEYIYKFVSKEPWPAARDAKRNPLDQGTLFVARFDADKTGEWLALVFGTRGLDPEHGFSDQNNVLLETRRAADVLGATKMDRPEWIAARKRGELFVNLTNNTKRGNEGRPGADAANPRAPNPFGHIVRIAERSGDWDDTRFDWEIFVDCGDPASPDPAKRGSARVAFASPDGLYCDAAGRVWIETDVSTASLNRGEYAPFGNNQLLAADPTTREIRRFLTGPTGCEVTGITMTPDGRAMFVNIQHPGETANDRSDPARPKAVSSWPDGKKGGRPRSATIVIQKDDGGVIGT